MSKAPWQLLTRHDSSSEVERQEFPREAEALTAWHLARGLENFDAGGFVLLVKDRKLVRGFGLLAGKAQALIDQMDAEPDQPEKGERAAPSPSPETPETPETLEPAAPQQAKPVRQPVHIPSVREVWTDKERG